MNKFVRNCPRCDVEIAYPNKGRLNQATKRNSKCNKGCLGKSNSLLHKICSECNNSKLFEEFGKDKGCPGGLSPKCKVCRSNISKEFNKNNSEKISEYQKEYRKSNSKMISKRQKEYYLGNLEQLSTKNKEWRKNNPDKVKEGQAKWRKNNQDKVKTNGRKSSRKRRAKKLSVKENYTSTQEAITREAFNDQCYNCSSTEKLCIDHHRPISKGHALTLQNAVILCGSCNSSKGPKKPEEFYGIEKCVELDQVLSTISDE